MDKKDIALAIVGFVIVLLIAAASWTLRIYFYKWILG